MAMAVGLIVLIVITVLFHFLSPWWLTPLASNWSLLDSNLTLTFVVTGVVYIALNGFLVWVVIKYRHREGSKAHYEPESTKIEWWLSIVTTVGVVAILAPGLWALALVVKVPDNAKVVEVVGQQWHWSFRFPGEDGVLGQVAVGQMSVDNPFGMKPDDPAGLDDVLVANGELHLPLDTPYKFVLRSKDVLHNFTVPQFRVKMDLIPGMTPYVWLTPTRTGRFDILCEELCGIGHFAMRGAVVVDEQAAFDDWLDSYPTFAEVLARPAPDAVAGQGLYPVCGACHGARGEGNEMLNAPKLAGQHGWYLKRQLKNFQLGLRGSNASDTFGAQMAPMAAVLVDDAAIDNVVAYITSLEETESPSTISGDAVRGEEIFVTCKSCHGAQGQGIWALNAPRLNGTNDWYIARQLKNYKQGIRGSHPQDLYGKQMTLMMVVLRDDQAINDLVAYINTL
ncbi:MAG: c-type cytochrome [Proteobacteria bacterium]|nr:c-type cytochrome [Pseudomonadota bacterium]